MNKYENARRKLIEGFLLLIREKDFLDIGVKELCLAAGVHRSTFYAHYDNTFELLEDCRKHLVEAFLGTYTAEQRRRFEEGRLERNYITEEYLLPYLRMLKRNRALYAAYRKLRLAGRDDPFFEDLLERIAYPVARTHGRPLDEKAIRYVTRFYVEGINAIVRAWIEDGCLEGEEQIAGLVSSLVHPEG